MKLVPIIKLIGSLIVSLPKNLTFSFLVLFWIPKIKIENKQKLKMIAKINFLRGNNIFFDSYHLNTNTNYKLSF